MWFADTTSGGGPGQGPSSGPPIRIGHALSDPACFSSPRKISAVSVVDTGLHVLELDNDLRLSEHLIIVLDRGVTVVLSDSEPHKS